ncbi:MAG TPA: CYTH domain-containing protein [Planctomycetota bacterium]|nr:CYTH domain-containing protein [Planctomycetota bacterium]
MSEGRERELKFRIPGREDWLSLREDPGRGEKGTVRRQVNHYFDAPDGRLIRARAMLRLRRETDTDAATERPRAILTFKQGAEERPGLFDSREVEEEIGDAAAADLLERPESMLGLETRPVAELVRRFGRLPLVLLGSLENERVERRSGAFVLEVDRLVFPDGTEAYELEIEVESIEAERLAHAAVARLREEGLVLEPERLTKLERLLDWRSRRLLGRPK